MMFELILYQPQIPPNTGNIIRLCANSGARLHLIEPLGFTLEEKALRRAGLDYHALASLTLHPDLPACINSLGKVPLLAITRHGSRCYTEHRFQPGSALLFGSETAGLPVSIRDKIAAQHQLFIPMRDGNRSLNLSNAAALVLYEAWRQHGFAGAG